MKIFIELRDKGHPDYFMSECGSVEDLKCSYDTQQLNEKVTLLLILVQNDWFCIYFYPQIVKAQEILNYWNTTVHTLHSNYKWLLFFRIPKLMQLCKYLDSSDTTLEHGIYQEIQFLLQRKGNSDQKKRLKSIHVIHAYTAYINKITYFFINTGSFIPSPNQIRFKCLSTNRNYWLIFKNTVH